MVRVCRCWAARHVPRERLGRSKSAGIGTRGVLVLLTVAIFAGSLTGCTSYLRRKQLESVAKDWSLSIRASQVIPVYPLSEDLQPGDVFLAQTTVQDQADQYSKRGFLPLDQLVTRLGGMEYPRFYRDAYWSGDYATTPHPRPQPQLGADQGQPDSSAKGSDPPEKPRGTRFPDAKVPRVAFPSYDFTVQSGAGVKIAVPVQGVPLGLALMGTSSATGSITISDAFTYGTDGETLLRRLNEWAFGDVRAELARIAKSTKMQLYLRIVSRVYLVGAVVVSLQNQAARSAGLDVGAAKEVSLVDLKKEQVDELKTVADSYREALGALSGALNAGLPGGSIRLAAATRGSVILREDFDRPLVVGYLGFDVPVRENGSLGPPIATRDVLEGAKVVPDFGLEGSQLRTNSFAYLRTAHYRLQKLAAEASDPRVKTQAADFVSKLDKLQTLAPPNYPVPVYQRDRSDLSVFRQKGATVGASGFAKVTTYLSNLNESVREIEAVLPLSDGKIEGKPIDGNARKALLVVRNETADELETIMAKLKADRDFNEAIDFAGATQ